MGMNPDESLLHDQTLRLGGEKQANADAQKMLTDKKPSHSEKQAPDVQSFSDTLISGAEASMKPFQTLRTKRGFFSVWQVLILVVLALLISGTAGTLFAISTSHTKKFSTAEQNFSTTSSATPTKSTEPNTFVPFRNTTFSINYPSDWKQTQHNSIFLFSRSDAVTKFAVGLQEHTPSPVEIISELTGMVLSCQQEMNLAMPITINGVVWQQSVWDCFLGGTIYIAHVLTTFTQQPPAEVAIVYGGYQKVSSPTLINFAQANTRYFQSMLQSFHLT